MESLAPCAKPKKTDHLGFSFFSQLSLTNGRPGRVQMLFTYHGGSNDIRAFKSVYALYVWIYSVGGKEYHAWDRTGFMVLVRTQRHF